MDKKYIEFYQNFHKAFDGKSNHCFVQVSLFGVKTKAILLLFLSIFFSTNSYSDYLRTGPVEYENCIWSFVIELCKWEIGDSFLMGQKLYRFKTRYDNREITEVVNNNTMCYSNTVPGYIYFKGEYKSRSNEIRFKCRYVR